MQSESFQKSLKFWAASLDGAESLLTDLPLDRPRIGVDRKQSPASPQPVKLILPKSLSQAISAWQAETKTTLFMCMMASLQLLLHKVCQQTDVCVGSVAANRYRPELEPLIGMFVNTLPYRTTIEKEHTFAQIQATVRDLCVNVMRHSVVPFDMLVHKFAVSLLVFCVLIFLSVTV